MSVYTRINTRNICKLVCVQHQIVNIVTTKRHTYYCTLNSMHWHPLVECVNNFNFQLFTSTFLIKLRKRKLLFSSSSNVFVRDFGLSFNGMVFKESRSYNVCVNRMTTHFDLLLLLFFSSKLSGRTHTGMREFSHCNHSRLNGHIGI